MPLTEFWSREAALTAVCETVRACVPELGAGAVYQGDRDSTKLRPSCRVYPVSEPVEAAWLDQRSLVKQAQVWLVTVLGAVVGEVYRTTLLGGDALYTAQPGDDIEAIRDEQLVALAALGKPVALAAVGDAAFTIAGSVAGQHLAVAVTENMSAALQQDNLHRRAVMPSTWTIRFEFEEQPGVDGTEPRAPDWATRLRGWLQQDASADVLRAAGIDFAQVIARGALAFEDRGKTTHLEFLDVEFTALQGLGIDVPSIESFGSAPTVEVSNAP